VAKRKRRESPAPAGSARREPREPSPRRHRLPLADAVAITALAAVLAGSALLVDPSAHASFDAPKRLATLAGISIAAFAAFGLAGRERSPSEAWRDLSPAARIALLAAAGALAWAALSTILSPRRAASLDSLRALALYALLLPLGASRSFEKGRGLLAAVFLSGAAVNAAVSLLQSVGVELFRLETFGSRNETGAYAGNVGYLALSLSLAAVLSIGVVLAVRRPLTRAVTAAALLLFLAGLLVNRNLTALLAAAAGGAVLLAARFGRRSIAPIAGALVALALAVGLYAPLRQRAAETVRAARSGDWDRLLTYRAGAWAAAFEMARERPLAGFGPGTYAAEFVPHRLRAEIAARRRFVNPLLTSSYSEAHCEYLQALAETGLLGGLAAIAAAAALLTGLGRVARDGNGRAAAEAALLLAFLAAGAAAALTWFPLQRPISAVPLLLAAGRGWRLAATRPEPPPA